MITRQEAEYISSALSRPLPGDARQSGREHFIDTIASIVAGSALPVGPIATDYVRPLGGAAEATVIGSNIVTTAINAAMANGNMAHGDETDDSHAPSLTHPGCAIVPAALAMAEKYGRSGHDLITAIVLGYDIGTRLSMSLGAGAFFDHYDHSSHAFGGYFGACAAASALAGLDAKRTEWAIAYAVQLTSGIPCWYRDPEHIEKAFMFAGMPAQGGTQAALMAAAGFVGSAEPLEGTPGLYSAFPDKCDPARMTEALGERFEVQRTTIKKWSTGSPIQGALDSLETLVNDHGFKPEEVEKIHIVLPPRRALAVNGRDMPAVNIQHQLSLLLIDGTVTFRSGHDEERMTSDPAIAAMRERITVAGDPAQPEGGTAHVTVTLRDGRELYKHTAYVRGTPNNPMTPEEIITKARDIMTTSSLTRVDEALDALINIDAVQDVRDLRPLLSVV